MGEAFGAGIEAVDAAAVGADPYLFGPRFLVEAEYRFGAQPVGAHRLRADMDLHVRFADDDQAAADPSGPDRAVRIAVERADGVARQGVRVSGQVFQYRDPLRLRVEDVDAAAVGADPDFALLLGHAEDHVVAQFRVCGVVDRDLTPFRIETLDAPVVGREPYPALRVDQNRRVFLVAAECRLPGLPAPGIHLQESVPAVEAEEIPVLQRIQRVYGVGVLPAEGQQQPDFVIGIVIAEDLVLRSEEHAARNRAGAMDYEISPPPARTAVSGRKNRLFQDDSGPVPCLSAPRFDRGCLRRSVRCCCPAGRVRPCRAKSSGGAGSCRSASVPPSRSRSRRIPVFRHGRTGRWRAFRLGA